jgi:hypothetical protein
VEGAALIADPDPTRPKLSRVGKPAGMVAGIWGSGHRRGDQILHLLAALAQVITLWFSAIDRLVHRYEGAPVPWLELIDFGPRGGKRDRHIGAAQRWVDGAASHRSTRWGLDEGLTLGGLGGGPSYSRSTGTSATRPPDDADPELGPLGNDQLVALIERVEARSRSVRDVPQVGSPILAAADADVARPRLGGGDTAIWPG